MTNQECYEYLKSILKESVKRDLEYYTFLKAKRPLSKTAMETVDRDIAKSIEGDKSCREFLNRALILLESSSK